MYKKADFPKNFNEFIGNNNTKQVLITLKNNWQSCYRLIPHLILYGQPGLGKTTLSRILASEAKTNLHEFIGSQFNIANLNILLNDMKKGDFVFIDEIHDLAGKVVEIMYPIMTDFKFNKKIYSECYVQQDTEPFTLIGATTNLGKLPKPFRDRFRYSLNLEDYTDQEINDIILLYCNEIKKKEGLIIKQEVINALVLISQNVPRLTKNYLYACVDSAINEKVAEINLELFNHVLLLLGVNKYGLNKTQMQILNVLSKSGKPTGVSSISSSSGVPNKDIESNEQFLLKKTKRLEN